jgi:hypothetical protein
MTGPKVVARSGPFRASIRTASASTALYFWTYTHRTEQLLVRMAGDLRGFVELVNDDLAHHRRIPARALLMIACASS